MMADSPEIARLGHSVPSDTLCTSASRNRSNAAKRGGHSQNAAQASVLLPLARLCSQLYCQKVLMASVEVDAWLAEGERLLELCSSATDDQRAAVSAALQDAAAVMRCTQSARRSTALESLPADIVDTALMFLDVEGLNMLGTANHGFGARTAGATVAWNALTRRTFPVEALVNKNVLKLKGRESFHRMARLWRGNSYDDAMRLASPYPPPPISAYSMLVRISTADGRRLAEGLCDIGYSTDNSFLVDANALWRSCLPLSVAQNFRVSLALLRKADGKLLHIASDLVPCLYPEAEGVILECQTCSTKSALYPLHATESEERLEEVVSERDEYVEYWLEHFLVLEGCRYTDNGRELQAVEDFVVAVWENEESEGYVPCSRLLACYAANTDWV